LVWGAAYCRAYRLAKPHPASLADADAQAQAAAAQLAFVARLPNAEAWTTYLRDQEQRTGPPRRPPGS
jgi:hypothetical protein